MKKILIFLLITTIKSDNIDFEWNYTNQNWNSEKNSCSGKRQSPISIKKVLPVNCKTSITLNFLKKKLKTNIDINKGFKTKGEFAKLLLKTEKDQNSEKILKTETGEKHKFLYNSLQFHIHTPSEHKINDKHYDLELHIVFQIASKDSSKTPDKLAVLAFFFNESEHESQFLKEWDVENNLNKNFDFSLEKFSEDFNEGLDEYFYYKGSLTTPGCDEIVNWFVFKNPIDMSKEQKLFFEKFFKEKEDFAGLGNNRKVQELNGRVIGTGSIKKCSGPWEEEELEGVWIFEALKIFLVFWVFC